MTLEPGSRIGRYEIVAQAGAGGMGEVYRARDTRLDRTVAIKVLPALVADDPSFQARFEREARAVSGLSHPRICALYDVGHDEGVHYLVMEYLEGETLATRIERGPLELDEALRCATQIAEALAAAHKAGVMHRDLKPGNVMLTKSGAKLLDFGLAKPLQDPTSGQTMTMAATAASPLTATGTVIGTFQYMAPEVLEGGEVDARSDIFAFGALLHEMVSGRKAFQGKTQASVAAAILKEDTRPLSTIVAAVPPALDRVVRRCLAKDPDERWQSATDLARELRWIAEGNAPAAEAASGTPSRGSARTAWSVAGLLAVVAIVLGVMVLRPTVEPSRDPIRFEIHPPEGTLLRTMYEAAAPPAVSPDGRHVVFGVMSGEDNRLWIRTLDAEPRPLDGTENGNRPFWSPDSRSIGFFTLSELRRIDIDGGPPLTICAANAGRGGTWNREGTIVLSPLSDSGLYRVPAGGGEPTPVTELGNSPLESSHRYPRFLPDGRHFIYLALGASGASGAGVESEHRVMVGSLDGGEPRLLMKGASNTVYAGGHLVYRRGQALRARPFDTDRLEFTGEARTLAASVQYDAGYERAVFSASDRLLAYVGGAFSGQTHSKLLDRSGNLVRTIAEADEVFQSRFSPDSRRLATRVQNAQGEDLWIVDLERGVRTRLTFEGGVNGWPVWSPDGKSIAYGSDAGRGFDTLVRSADGSGEPRTLVEGLDMFPTTWSPDGKQLILNRWTEGGYDLWVKEIEEDSEPRPLLETPHNTTLPALSPDGHWLAYTSDESGRPEVYVTRYPSLDGKWQVSGTGGLEPLWDVDAGTLFYRSLSHSVMSSPVTITGSQISFGATSKLFDLYSSLDIEEKSFDLSADGKHFIANVVSEEHLRAPITVVADWTSGFGE